MHWHDWLIVLTIGALLWGAYFLGPTGSAPVPSPGPVLAVAQDAYRTLPLGPYAISAALIVALAAVLHVALIRRSTPRMAATGAIALCVFIIGLTLMISPQNFIGTGDLPPRYIDYPDIFAQWARLSTIGVSLALSALITLLGLSLRAWLHRRRLRKR